MKKFASIFILLASLLIGCNAQTSKAVKTIDCAAFEKFINANKKLQLIDVRTTIEYSESHLQNANNININDGNFEQEILKLDKTKPILVYCKAGGRSEKAANKLAELGFKEIYNLDGGILKWIEEKKPIVK